MATSAQTKPPQPILPPASQSQGKAPDERLIVHNDLISFNVTVTDNFGRIISDLTKSNFAVSDEKQQQEIVFFSDNDLPVSIGIIYDRTDSMKGGGKQDFAHSALVRFFEHSHKDDDYFLITLQNGRSKLAQDWTRDDKTILNALTLAETGGYTSFYDGLYLATEKVQQGSHTKRAILAISDCMDNNSRYSLNELKRLLKESDVTLYIIGISGKGDPEPSNSAPHNTGELSDLAAASGGRAFSGLEDTIEGIYEQIALELRHQYSIGYRPANFKPDGSWHHVKVNVTPPPGWPRLFVRSREGYFALPDAR